METSAVVVVVSLDEANMVIPNTITRTNLAAVEPLTNLPLPRGIIPLLLDVIIPVMTIIQTLILALIPSAATTICALMDTPTSILMTMEVMDIMPLINIPSLKNIIQSAAITICVLMNMPRSILTREAVDLLSALTKKLKNPLWEKT